MPKKPKILTRTLYCYVRPASDQFVRANYRRLGFSSYSEYVDALITNARAKRVGRVAKAARKSA